MHNSTCPPHPPYPRCPLSAQACAAARHVCRHHHPGLETFQTRKAAKWETVTPVGQTPRQPVPATLSQLSRLSPAPDVLLAAPRCGGPPARSVMPISCWWPRLESGHTLEHFCPRTCFWSHHLLPATQSNNGLFVPSDPGIMESRDNECMHIFNDGSSQVEKSSRSIDREGF